MTHIEIAKKVLARALFEDGARLEMLRHCDAAHFPASYRSLFLAVREHSLNNGSAFSPEILADRQPNLKDVILGLSDEAFTGADQAYWVERLRECSEQERVRFALGRMGDLLSKDQRPYGEKRSEIVETLMTAIHTEEMSRIVTVTNDVTSEDGPSEKFKADYLPWDSLIGGMTPGTLHVLAGRPGRGKTTMACQFTRGVAGLGNPVVMVPLELGEVRTRRLLRVQGHIPDGIHIIQKPSRKWVTLRHDLKWGIEVKKVRVIVIDHLGFLSLPRQRNQNRVEEVGEILKGLLELLQETETACVLVCPLNRQPEGRKTEKPILSDLRESGEIEYLADTVTFLWMRNGEKENATRPKFGLGVAKNRDGMEGGQDIIFDRPRRCFWPGTESPF